MSFTGVLGLTALAAAVTLFGGPSAGAQPSADPACADAHFLVGEWDVTAGDGSPISSVVFEKGDDGCYLVETWKGISEGMPDFFCMMAYNPKKGDWGYFSASANPGGLRQRFEDGAIIGNEFRFTTRELDEGKSGRFSYFKLPDGRLREVSVLSTDNGKTWETEYEFFWQRKK